MEREPSPGGPSCGGEGVCYAVAICCRGCGCRRLSMMSLSLLPATSLAPSSQARSQNRGLQRGPELLVLDFFYVSYSSKVRSPSCSGSMNNTASGHGREQARPGSARPRESF